MNFFIDNFEITESPEGKLVTFACDTPELLTFVNALQGLPEETEAKSGVIADDAVVRFTEQTSLVIAGAGESLKQGHFTLLGVIHQKGEVKPVIALNVTP